MGTIVAIPSKGTVLVVLTDGDGSDMLVPVAQISAHRSQICDGVSRTSTTLPSTARGAKRAPVGPFFP